MNTLLPNHDMPKSLSDYLTSKLKNDPDGYYRFVFEVPDTDNDRDLTVFVVEKSGDNYIGNFMIHFDQCLDQSRYLRHTFYDLEREWASILGLQGTFKDDNLTVFEIDYALKEIMSQVKLHLARCVSIGALSECELYEFKENPIFDLSKESDAKRDVA